jgi:histone deacetylase complex regulatory component SIN3
MPLGGAAGMGAIGGAAPPQSDKPSTPTSTPTTTLNGAQISSAQQILEAISLGTIAPDAARALLQTLGIDSATAAVMVDSQSAIKLEPPESPTAPPTPATAPAKHSEDYDKALRRVTEYKQIEARYGDNADAVVQMQQQLASLHERQQAISDVVKALGEAFGGE